MRNILILAALFGLGIYGYKQYQAKKDKSPKVKA